MPASVLFRILRYALAVACVTAVFGLRAAELEAREPAALAATHAVDFPPL